MYESKPLSEQTIKMQIQETEKEIDSQIDDIRQDVQIGSIQLEVKIQNIKKLKVTLVRKYDQLKLYETLKTRSHEKQTTIQHI